VGYVAFIYEQQEESHSKKNYLMLPATDLSIISATDSRYWDWPSMKESR
jgi:hypothetical protein